MKRGGSSTKVDTSGRKIGIVAGSGPDAGIDLWGKLLQTNREHLGDSFRGDVDAPHVVIYSNPTLGLSMDLAKHGDVVWRELSCALRGISSFVDYVCIACYTMHIFEERIRALGLPAEFVSLVDVVVEHLRSRSFPRVGLLTAGAIVTSPSPLLTALGRHCEVETVSDPAAVRQLVFEIKAGEPRNPDLINRFKEIISDMASDTVVLGCTELSLVQIELEGKELVDGVSLLAEGLIRRARGASQDPMSGGEIPI